MSSLRGNPGRWKPRAGCVTMWMEGLDQSASRKLVKEYSV